MFTVIVAKVASTLRAWFSKLAAKIDAHATTRARHAVRGWELRRAGREIDRYGGGRWARN
jgi:hypothetical protein